MALGLEEWVRPGDERGVNGGTGGGVFTDVLEAKFVTKRSEPETAMPNGLFSRLMSEALTVAPEVVYSPTVFE